MYVYPGYQGSQFADGFYERQQPYPYPFNQYYLNHHPNYLYYGQIHPHHPHHSQYHEHHHHPFPGYLYPWHHYY
ncbi:hypothetical protein [Bacillus sp. REN3]|uniref:hypothetical protein n=1 Tax=Bacillus sp. REN3 TaxID=2802440 RepID=UPI001AED2525|nr:hypothetical protein [Bacillus sp. REN3]